MELNFKNRYIDRASKFFLASSLLLLTVSVGAQSNYPFAYSMMAGAGGMFNLYSGGAVGTGTFGNGTPYLTRLPYNSFYGYGGIGSGWGGGWGGAGWGNGSFGWYPYPGMYSYGNPYAQMNMGWPFYGVNPYAYYNCYYYNPNFCGNSCWSVDADTRRDRDSSRGGWTRTWDSKGPSRPAVTTSTATPATSTTAAVTTTTKVETATTTVLATTTTNALPVGTLAVTTSTGGSEGGGHIQNNDRAPACEDKLKSYAQSRVEGKFCVYCSKEGTNAKDQPGEKLGPTREVLNKYLDQGMNLGARRALALLYQDCSILDPDFLVCPGQNIDPAAEIVCEENNPGVKPCHRFIRNLDGLVKAHPILNIICPKKNKCEAAGGYDPCQTPPIFNFGGKAGVAANGTLDPYARGGHNIQPIMNPKTKTLAKPTSIDGYGLDCSGFQCLGMAAAGLKFKPNSSECSGTDSFMRANASTSCFDNVKFTSEASLMPGDLMVFRGHMLMVDSVEGKDKAADAVGKDPFGIEKWGRKTDGNLDCSNPDPTKLNFVLIQSGTTGNGYGPYRIQASDYFPKTAASLDGGIAALRNMMIKACESKKAGASSQPVSVDDSRGPLFTVKRHLGSNKSGCVGEPTKIKGSACLNGNCAAFDGVK